MEKAIAVTAVEFREDLYPRFEPCQKTIQKYANSIDFLPPILINQNNILIDGFHRWKGHQLNGEAEIKCKTIETKSEKELKRLAFQYNASHGLQLSDAEKRQYAQEMCGEVGSKELAALLCVSRKTIDNWTSTQREANEEERVRKFVELYLRTPSTYQSIADAFGVPKQTVVDTVKKYGNGKITEFVQTLKPYLYTIWNQSKQDNSTPSHFGAFPHVYMQSLLHYHTKPLEVVFDPFAGAGTTVDVCKLMMRRYYCCDLNPKPGREKDIYKHDITSGLPEDLPLPTLTFLDPPYWRQAAGKYSDDIADLGNMDSLESFNHAMNCLFKNIIDRRVKKIATVIMPTQYKNDFIYTDHSFDFYDALKNKYKITARYILPYSTQQYNAQMVEKAKEKTKCLALHRDLIVFERI